MTHFLILGTDTDVGKTTFALLWLHAFGERYSYWKPIETGDSDAERVARFCPNVVVHPSLLRLKAPVAPPLAARQEGVRVPAAKTIADALPRTPNAEGLIVETFGGPFSPLNEDELQLNLIRALALPCVLVSSPKLGGIGRTLQCLTALHAEGIETAAVVFLGERDAFTEETVRQHTLNTTVLSVMPPVEWNSNALAAAARGQRAELERLTFKKREWLPHLLLAEDRRTVWHPYTPLLGADEPLVCIGAQDEF